MIDTRNRTRPAALALAGLALLLAAAAAPAADAPLRVIVFGAHPDDCDLDAGGTAALWAAKGHQVKFVSRDERRRRPPVRGRRGARDAGGAPRPRRRGAGSASPSTRCSTTTTASSSRRSPCGSEVIRRIRRWNADVVIAPRPNDYHPDHRYTGVLVQDTAYMVMVPNVCPDTPPLRKNPVFLYTQDHFQRPNPFRPDVAVAIDSVIDQKIHALDAHVSQVYEWLPWVEGALDTVPKDPAARLAWLQQQRSGRPIAEDVRAALRKWYGPRADAVKNAEAFEVCEYGRQPSEADLRRLFPFFD